MSADEIRLLEVKDNLQMEVLQHLMHLYLHDLSEFTTDLQTDPKGRFEYEGIHLYLEKEQLRAFLIQYKQIPVGFILLNQPPYTPNNVDHSVHELFVLRGYRKMGLAKAAVLKLLTQYQGSYVILQLAANQKAISFWKSFYASNDIEYMEKKELYDGDVCHFQWFTFSKK